MIFFKEVKVLNNACTLIIRPYDNFYAGGRGDKFSDQTEP